MKKQLICSVILCLFSFITHADGLFNFFNNEPTPSIIPPITLLSSTPDITPQAATPDISVLPAKKEETPAPAPKEITTIIWDLSFTLIETSKVGLASEIGIGDFFVSSLFGGKGIEEFRALTCQVLEKGSGKQTRENPYLDDSGKPMPNLMVDWFRGKQTPEEICKKAKQHIHDWDKEIGFDSPREKRIIEKAIETVINPEILSKHTAVIQRGLKIVEECANKKNKDGKQKYRMMVLGNWEKTAFNLFAESKEGKKLMKFFAKEDIILSGTCGLMKPDKDIFEHLLKKHNLDAETCIFIDDQEANITAAKACKMQTIHLENYNYKKVRKKLKELKIL